MARHRTLLAGLVAGTLALTGCTTSGAVDTSRDGDLRVVATTTEVADFTRNLLSDDAEITQLIEPNQSAHSFDPSAAQLLDLKRADVLIESGAGLETWLDDAVEASGFSGDRIDASDGIDLDDDDTVAFPDGYGDPDAASDAPSPDDPSNDASDASAPERTAGGDGDQSGDQGGDADDTTTEIPDMPFTPPVRPSGEPEDNDAGHDHGDTHRGANPHIWVDPHRAAAMVDNIARGLDQVQRVDAASVDANAADYIQRLKDLDEWIQTNMDRVPASDRLLVSNHDAFGYFVSAYGITYVGSIIPSFDDNAEPSSAEIDSLVSAIEKTGVTAVFSEASLSPKAAETIAREADVAVYSGDDALYGDSLGPADSDGATYLTSQVHNVRRIVESWGITATEPPDDVRANA